MPRVVCPDCRRRRIVSPKTFAKYGGVTRCLRCGNRARSRSQPKGSAWTDRANRMNQTPTPATTPATAPPGTPGKVAALIERYERGEALYHPRDARANCD